MQMSLLSEEKQKVEAQVSETHHAARRSGPSPAFQTGNKWGK